MSASLLAAGATLLAALNAQKADPPGKFRVAIWNYYPQTASPTPGHTVHNLIVAFDNDSKEEVVSVEIEATLVKDDKPVVRRSAIRVERFTDHTFMSRHGAVPGQRAFADVPLAFDLPFGAWEPRDGAEFKIVSFQTYKGRRDLHDLGQFATWLKGATEAEVRSEFARDPGLRDAKNEDGYTPLAVAYFFGTRKQIEAMTQRPTFGHPAYPQGMSTFHLAARNPHADAMDAALALGGDPNARMDNGATPLMIAVNSSKPDATRWLLGHGADAEAKDKAGWTAMRYAIRSDDEGLVRLLADHGARLTGHGADGFGPMQYAAVRGDDRILAILLAAGASVDDRDSKYGVTPLMAAARGQSRRAVRWLLSHGAKLDLRDAKGQNAFAYAKVRNEDGGEAWLRGIVDEVKGSPPIPR